MNKEKPQVLPNRKEWRASMRGFKHLRVAKKTKTKGAFGRLSEYMMDIKKKCDLKKAKKMKPIETKRDAKFNAQPVETKEVKEKKDE